jgi:signal transduction histidine kinase
MLLQSTSGKQRFMLALLLYFFSLSVIQLGAQNHAVVRTYNSLNGANENEAYQNLRSGDYSVMSTSTPNLGLSEGFQYLSFSVKAIASDVNTFCFIGNSTIDSIYLYQLDHGLNLIGFSGASVPFNKRGSSLSSFMFDLGIKNGESGEFLLKVKSSKQLICPVQVGLERDFVSMSVSQDNLMYVYLGIMIVLLLYNLFLAISTSDKSYFYYVFYLLTVGFVQVSLLGIGSKIFWPNSIWLSQHSVHLSGALSGIATTLFARDFIKTKLHTPWLDKILKGYLLIYVGVIALILNGSLLLSYNLINFCAAASLILLFAALKSAKSGERSAKFFVFAWTIFLVSVTAFVMKDYGLVPYNTMTIYALPLGSALEGILLSFALADKINKLKLEKEEADAQRIKTIESQNEMLEDKVHERTSELEDAKDKIQSQYDHLRLTQKQLVESEKLAGLGQMTAGIAHELNNPINFVQSNVGPLHRDIEDVVGLLHDYYQLPENPEPGDLRKLKEKYKEVDIDYVTKEIHQLLRGIEEGSKRTAEIVRGLRIFARADKDTLVPANVNECLNSTIVVMMSITKGQVTLDKHLDPELPYIECFPGKLNQVIANLLSNAVAATKLPGRTSMDRHVSITSCYDEKNVYISVKDNGVGMDQATVEKIFMPFFTTKAVGEGTGLGLSIAKSIIEDHGGQIVVKSDPGHGSEFLIHLPRIPKGFSRSAA